MAVTKVVKEGDGCDQTYRGSASRGLQSPFLPVPLTGAHRFFPIITQGFNPGSSRPGGTRAPTAGVVKEGDGCDQTYRGSASRGLQSPFLPVPLSGAHRFFPIIAQGFNPGWPCAPAVAQRVGQEIKKLPRPRLGSFSPFINCPILILGNFCKILNVLQKGRVVAGNQS